ncbi:MAG: hypothetical protein K2N14_00960, partial [Clostridia bacterium]|nr:hypothetical protein [Clostridia bacterium]
MKKTNREQQKLKRAKRRWERELEQRIAEEPDVPIDYACFPELRNSRAYAKHPRDLGNLLYSFSDSRTWVDLPKGQRFRQKFDPHQVFLITFAVLFCLWFVVALIYQLCTTTNAGRTILHLLPTLLIIAVGTAILLLSAFRSWGSVLRWAFKHNLAHGHDAISRRQLADMKADLERADRRKPFENKIEITPEYIILK